MGKSEFIDQLRRALNGNVPEQEVYRSVQYYNEYFENNKRSGKSEEQTAEELGSPKLIAKSIIASMGTPRQNDYSDAYDADYDNSSPFGGMGYEERYTSERFTLPWWKKAGLVLMGLIIVIGIVFLISGLLTLFIKIAVPIIIIYLIYYGIRTIFKI